MTQTFDRPTPSCPTGQAHTRGLSLHLGFIGVGFFIQDYLAMTGGGGILHAAIRGISRGIFQSQRSGDDQSLGWMAILESAASQLHPVVRASVVGHHSVFHELIVK
jgi:hypothetical protein